MNLSKFAGVVAWAYSVNAQQPVSLTCLPAPRPEGPPDKLRTYTIPSIGINQRHAQTRGGGIFVPDVNVMYNAAMDRLGSSDQVSISLQNQLLPGQKPANSFTHLVYGLKIRTRFGDKTFYYFLDNTDSCTRIENIPGIDWSQNAIVDANLYWLV